MKITSLQEYGLRCVYQLACGGDSYPQNITAIAKKEGISPDYVGKILFQLRKSKIVRSVRGVKGGYILTRSPEQLKIGEVMRALSEKPVRMGKIRQDLCGQFPGSEKKCIHLSRCSLRMLWSVVMAQIYNVLNRLPISFLMGEEKEVHTRIMNLLPKIKN